MSAPGLSRFGSSTHARRLARSFWAAPAPIVSRLMRCVRSGPKVPLALGPARVAADAGGGFEHQATGLGLGIARRGLALRLHPPLEVVGRMHHHAQQHLGMLRAAKLGALADVGAALRGRQPYDVAAIRNDVRLAG